MVETTTDPRLGSEEQEDSRPLVSRRWEDSYRRGGCVGIHVGRPVSRGYYRSNVGAGRAALVARNRNATQEHPTSIWHSL